uniref:Mesothelin n=1 Tax=Crocodylus porosus TaxID=8502 RepID=A0A7M4FBU9_CROPO
SYQHLNNIQGLQSLSGEWGECRQAAGSTAVVWDIELSPSVLQGFTCAAANEMETEKFQQLAKAMKQKNVRLGEEQVGPSTEVSCSSFCKDAPKSFIKAPPPQTRWGWTANLGVLQRDSPQSKQLLLEALACLVRTRVSEEKARVLGHLVCDLGGEYIRGSGGSLLKWLSQCKSFTPDQEEAIRDVISNGTTPFGPPSTWSASTLSELSGLFLVLDQSILHKIPRVCCQQASRSPCLYSLSHQRHLIFAPTDCPSDKTVTDDVAMNELMPILYSPQDLQACLTAAILEKHLARLITYPFTDEQLSVLKNKLDEAYPDGYPEKILPNLGALTALVTVNDTKKWNISSADTLAALLLAEPPDVRLFVPCIMGKVHAYCDFTDFRGNIGLLRGLLQDICPACMFLPAPGGAPAEDLRALSNNSVNMDIGTFAKLRRDSVLALTTDQVKGLLGVNLKDLKDAQYTSSLIKAWISLQKQPDLDKLGLGLTGGIPDGYILVTPQSTRMFMQPLFSSDWAYTSPLSEKEGSK